MQKSVQDSVQDNGNSGGVFVGEYKPHLKMNLIQMTLPDKPNSRNQRYIKYKEQEGKIRWNLQVYTTKHQSR